MPIELVKDSWPGAVREVTIGATAAEGGTRTSTVTVGGEKALPFMHFEAPMPHKPVVAMEIKDRRPDDWSPLLLETWQAVADDPVAWAKAAEEAGAELIQLTLSATDGEGNETTPESAVATVKAVLEATGVPLIVFGPGQAELDNALMVPVADATKGERLLLGLCEDKNYRTIVASAMANDHLVTARTPMDVNLAKQLNILDQRYEHALGPDYHGPDHRRFGLWNRVWLFGHGTFAAGGPPGGCHDPTAHAGYTGL